jgi:hypothetical protein
MKPVRTNGRFKALTLIEVIAVIAVTVLLIGILLPWWSNSWTPSTGMACSNHLKQVGLAARIFANDNDDKFPWQISTNTGGSREYQDVPNSAFRHFQVMSNEVSAPIILVCPQDKKRACATNWLAGLNDRNVSYFVGLNANETNANSLLSGDRYLTSSWQPTNGFLELTSRDTIGWTKRYHDYHGYIAFGDGSVQQLDSAGLQKALRNSGVATNRLAIP